MNQLAPSTPPEAFGRYLLYPAIARGGMATVHTARLVGAEGFTRLVAAKRLHPQFTDDPDFVTMFHDEACIASRIHHPNVVPVLDVVVAGNELILVQEYVHGVPLSQLMKIAQCAAEPISVDIVVAVLVGVLSGLHAAHEVRDELDRPLEIVHRDVSPANVMISVDGVPRLLDFGIAKARTSTHHTREGVFKGKLAYMAPEQLRMECIDRTADIYAAGVLAWELLVNRRVYDNRHELAFVTAVMNGELPSITAALEGSRGSIDGERWQGIEALEPIITRAMSPRSEERFATAADMLRAILDIRISATSMVVTEWVRTTGADFLDQRQRTLAANEESWRRTSVYTPTPMSGTQRAADRTMLPIATPSSPLSVSPSILSTHPASAPPPIDTGAYRITIGVPPLARMGAKLRASRLLPWIAGAALVLAAVLGGLLRGSSEPEPPSSNDLVITSPAIAPAVVATTLPISPASGPASSSAPALASASASPPASASASSSAVSAPAAVTWRPVHVTPPPPPRWVPPPRPAPPPPPASATASKVDCNPPFFFEGSKKIFKPTCL
jgi:serine/threonine-protein kinase